MLFGPLVALKLALVLVLGVIGEPFGGSGAVPEICIKLADFDTDLCVSKYVRGPPPSDSAPVLFSASGARSRLRRSGRFPSPGHLSCDVYASSPP